MQNNFPLRLEHTEVHVARPPHDVDSDMITSGSGEDSSSSSSEDHEEGRVEYNRDFLINFLPKLEYSALRTAVQQVCLIHYVNIYISLRKLQ
jgi:hypothetical protein